MAINSVSAGITCSIFHRSNQMVFSSLAGDQLPCCICMPASEVSKWILQEQMLIILMGLGVKNAICNIKRILCHSLEKENILFITLPLPRILNVWHRSQRGINSVHTRRVWHTSQTITQTCDSFINGEGCHLSVARGYGCWASFTWTTPVKHTSVSCMATRRLRRDHIRA